MTEPCTYGRRWVESNDSFTRRTPDDSEMCGKPMAGYTELGAPRCDDHLPKRYMVALGTNLTLTPDRHHDALTARVETAERIMPNVANFAHELAHLKNAVARQTKIGSDPDSTFAKAIAVNEQKIVDLETNLERRLSDVTAWVATDAEIERWDALVEQDKRFKTQRSIREHLAETAS